MRDDIGVLLLSLQRADFQARFLTDSDRRLIRNERVTCSIHVGGLPNSKWN